MKNLYIIYLVASTFWMLLSACSSDEHADIQGKGLLQLSVGIDSQTTDIETKAATADICKVQILNNKGEIIKKYDDAKDIPSDLWLLAGEYTVSASLGTPKKAEFDHPCYAGKQNISILANKSTQQEVKCRLVQSKVSIRATDAVKNSFKDYPVTVSMGADKLTFAKGATTSGYFYGAKGDEDLLCEVAAVTNDGTKISKKYTIEDIQPHTHYIINLDYKSNYEDGGLKFEISLSEEPDATDQEMGVALKKYPVLSHNNTLPNYTFLKEEIIIKNAIQIKIEGYPKLKELILNGSFMTDILNLSSTTDLLRLSTEERQEFEKRGIHFSDIIETTNKGLSCETTTLFFDIDAKNAFSKKTIDLSAKDSYSKERTINLEVTISPSTVTTVAIPIADIWATHAILYGKRIKDDATLAFEYKAEGELVWQTVTAETGKDTVSIKGLRSNTKYIYRATDETSPAGELTFTTESAFQIPNMNFDSWFKKGNAWYPAEDLSNENYWWDTANGGTSLLNINPTTGEADDVHTKGAGSHAARLASTVAAGKFAAGNLYTGKFGGLVNLSGAYLNFGKEYTNRPAQLKGWFKYQPGVKTHDPDNRLKGPNDVGSIFILLCDWSVPHYMNTTDPSTFIDFSKNNKSIIAYGEVPEERLSKKMDSYEAFTIDLKYRDLKKKPTYILIVASASKYGDYFTGSTSSVLLLDDFELIFKDEQVEDK